VNTATSAITPGIGPLSIGGKVAYADLMNTSPDDAALMLRYKDGDIAAFETLYKRHNDSLYRYLLRLSRNTATAEDLYQEVWSKIIKTRERYRPTAKFTTFLYRVAHNAFVDYVRRNKRYAGSAEVPIDAIEDAAQSLDDVAEKSLAREKMMYALQSLPDEQRDTFLLHEEAGLTLDEIAHVTGSNRETAKSRLRYATNKLRAAMAESAPNTKDLPRKRRNES
jgi:RNA polymerase sigma-70 factor (ECF subfamily)